MHITPPASRNIFLTLCLVVLAACQSPSPTPVAQDDIQIQKITENNTTTGQLIQTKTFDQCNAASSFNSQVTFSESSSDTFQKELILKAGGGAEAGVPTIAMIKLEGAIEEHFTVTKQISRSHAESAMINVPPNTRQEYTIVWREMRREGTVEYTLNGVPQIANYSYRIGLEFVSATGRDIDCSLPTETPLPTHTPDSSEVSTPTAVQLKTLADSCIFSKTWKPDAPDPSLGNAVTVASDGCYELEQLGILTTPGTLNFFKDTTNNTAASGIYTPISGTADIQFNIYVNALSTRLDNVAEIIFAVAPANDRLTSSSSARFKLHLEDPGEKKVVHFTLADAGENNGVNLGTQHYEYGRIYAIRLLLSATRMDIFINGYRMDERLELPIGSKVFYIGYTLPVYTEMDVRISDIIIDGTAK